MELEEGKLLKLDLAIGKDSYVVKGKVFVCKLYESLVSTMKEWDFIIMPGEQNLMTLKMDEVFGLGERPPIEPILPDDPEYPEVLRKEAKE